MWSATPNGCSCRHGVNDEHGIPHSGPRPVLFYSLPCDVPLFSTHIGRAAAGLISVGLRSPSTLVGKADAEQLEIQDSETQAAGEEEEGRPF